MPEFKLTKRIVFEASLITNCVDGTDAARKLHEWKPTNWDMRDGDWSSEPWLDPERLGAGWDESQPIYQVRPCRGHFHVTVCGEDVAIQGDPCKTREDAEAAIAAEIAATPASTSETPPRG